MKLNLYPNLVLLAVAACTLSPPPAAPLPTQLAFVKASNTGADDVFGWSVAVSGDPLVIGAPDQQSHA
jgi:hypothetical protein